MRAGLLCRVGMAVAIVAAPVIVGPMGFAQYAGPAESGVERAERASRVELIDEAGKRFQIADADLAELSVQSVDVTDGDRTLTYEGVSLHDVLHNYGVGFGEQLRGRRTPTVVLCEASDAYRVVFALAEIDPATTDKQVLLAFRCNGQPLPAEEGPFRLLTPGEKRRVRAIRMLTTIRIVNLIELPMTSAPGEAGEE